MDQKTRKINLKKEHKNTNNTVDDRERRFDLNCSYCPPNGGENKKNHSKHGKGKPKYKSKRKGR
jgi:hypothetical protein